MEPQSLIEMLARFASLPVETEESEQIRARLLSQIGDIENFLGAAEFEARLLAACALARIDPAKADIVLPVLIDGLSSEDEGHRVFAAFACRCLGPQASAAVPALIKGLDDEIAVNHVLKALAVIGTFQATPQLVEFLHRAGYDALAVENVQAINAVMALGAVGPEAREAIPALRNCLRFAETDDDLLRTLALESARAIWRISKDVDVPLQVAMQLLHDEDGTIKAHAADFLGEMGTAAWPALAGLQRLLGDESEYVRRHAREAMARIGTSRRPEEK